MSDIKLLKAIKKFKPDYIIINLGGGTQEILGMYIKKNLKFKTSILCTGAAISFTIKHLLIILLINIILVGYLD